MIIRLAAAALAALLLAGCSTSGTPASPPLTPSSPAAAATVAAPIPTGPPLTTKQAAQLFARLMAPLAQAISTFQSDANDQPPFSQYQAEGRALIAAVHRSQGQLAAANWPAQVQPSITSMMTTYEPEEIACTQAQINAGSYAVAQNVSGTNLQCTEAGQDETVATIRTILGIRG
jgi:hypothetical protein